MVAGIFPRANPNPFDLFRAADIVRDEASELAGLGWDYTRSHWPTSWAPYGYGLFAINNCTAALTTYGASTCAVQS
jgi:hypothetical protein